MKSAAVMQLPTHYWVKNIDVTLMFSAVPIILETSIITRKKRLFKNGGMQRGLPLLLQRIALISCLMIRTFSLHLTPVNHGIKHNDTVLFKFSFVPRFDLFDQDYIFRKQYFLITWISSNQCPIAVGSRSFKIIISVWQFGCLHMRFSVPPFDWRSHTVGGQIKIKTALWSFCSTVTGLSRLSGSLCVEFRVQVRLGVTYAGDKDSRVARIGQYFQYSSQMIQLFRIFY